MIGMEPAPSTIRAADLLLWPEGALGESAAIGSELDERLQQWSDWSESALLVAYERQSGNIRMNSMIFAEPRTRNLGRYKKSFLVPWAESVPYLARPFVSSGAPQPVAGAAWPTFGTNGIRIGPAICYDAYFPGLHEKYRNCDLIAVSGCEDADGTQALRESSLQIACLRAVEFRRASLRNVDGGYSGFVSSNGEVLRKFDLAAVREPIRIAAVLCERHDSLYAIAGDWPYVGALVFLTFRLVRRHFGATRKQERIA
jgi:apolipoprotein N-acyltransferase